MILRAAIVILLVLDIGVAAWWISGGNALQERAPVPLPADAPGLRLLSETAAPEPAAAKVATAAPMPAAPEATAQAEPAKPVDGQCLRFGPFADAAARDAARPALAGSSAVLAPRDTPAKPARGWKVHLPPFATREEAKAMGEKIEAAGITDWYVLNEGADANSIALGRYGGEQAARRREAELRAKGIPAQAVPLGDSVPQWWLDARLKPGAAAADLAGIAPSKPIDCATLR